MSVHDRRPKGLQNAHYRALWQSTGFETVKDVVEKLTAKWRLELGTGSTLDEYTMVSLKRDGRIEGLMLLVKEIERLANDSVDN